MKSAAITKVSKKLSSIVGTGRVSKPSNPSLSYKTIPDVIVRPKNNKEVAKIVKLAVKDRVPVVLVGDGSKVYVGSDQEPGGIGLDMGAMGDVVKISNEDLFVTLEPGVSWKKINADMSKKKLFLSTYPSSTPDATLGDWVNTGGMGIGSYKYGGIEQQVRSLEIVLANGAVISTGCKNVLNNSSGYNLTDLFVGSEGTLGVVTKVTLKVIPTPKEIRPTTFIFPGFDKASKAIQALTRIGATPYHVAFLDTEDLSLKGTVKKEAPGGATFVNIAFEGDSAIINHEEKAIDTVMKENGGKKATKGLAREEWNSRFSESRLKAQGPLFLLGTVFCPIPRLAEMREVSKNTLKKLKIKGAITGTVCDRSTAVVMIYAFSTQDRILKNKASVAIAKKLTDEAFKLGARPGGFGMRFQGNLKKMHGKGMLVMEDIKTNLDPHYILNP
jgi:glycolate oxidase